MLPFLTPKKLFKVEIFRLNLKSSSNNQSKYFPNWQKSAKICQENVFLYVMYFYLFCPGDLVTRTGEWEIQPVSSRLPGNLGELA